MKVLVIGAAGMIGRKLVERLTRDGALGGRTIASLHATDIVAPAPGPAPFPIASEACDIAAPYIAPKLVASRPDVIFLLASIVSGEAEADFEKGYSINLDGTRLILEAIRRERELSGASYCPRVVFTSSVAVFGAPLPDVIDDDFASTPLTSYGTQKAMAEVMLSDYTRRGFFDGVGLRLPTICVRPGRPNLAASGFFSGIIREPLAGLEAILPVPDTVRHWLASPRAAVTALRHAAAIDLAPLGARRNLMLPGLAVSVAEQIEALERVAGSKAVALIRRRPDPGIAKIVGGWAKAFAPRRAEALGFVGDSSFDDIIRIYIEDDFRP